jgi:hypothetical protein
MSSLNSVRHTFLHFLADNLVGISVHPVRRDASDPSTEILKINAVNVQFLGLDLDIAVSGQQAVIDVVNEDESTAVDWVSSVFALLSAAYYTPLLSYDDIQSPAPLGSNIMWDRHRVRFKKIALSDNYSHFSCVLDLKFHP